MEFERLSAPSLEGAVRAAGEGQDPGGGAERGQPPAPRAGILPARCR